MKYEYDERYDQKVKYISQEQAIVESGRTCFLGGSKCIIFIAVKGNKQVFRSSVGRVL